MRNKELEKKLISRKTAVSTIYTNNDNNLYKNKYE